MINQEKLANAIRIVTVPPILVTAMLMILYADCPTIFNGIIDLPMSIIWLGICPVLAYPLQKILPRMKDRGRTGQRTLAFVCSVIGYLVAASYGIISGVSQELMLIYNTYVFSVILLVFLNKICKKRASGHACSITSLLIFMIYFVSWEMAFLCAIIGGLSFWASLKLKRHLPMDLMAGSLVCMVSFSIALGIMQL